MKGVRFGTSAAAAALAALLSGCAQDQQVQTAVAPAGLEYRTDRFGADYQSTPMPSGGPAACRAACQQDQRCRAFTWVREGVQGPTPVCHLKDTVPTASPNDCCTSGVVRPTTGALMEQLRRRDAAFRLSGRASSERVIAAPES